jgi:hypothetical protein
VTREICDFGDSKDLSVPDMWDWVKAKQPHPERLLWIEPLLQKARKIVLSLQLVGVQTSLVSSALPLIPETGGIVATAIVDSGVTIEPPPTCLVDSGVELVPVLCNLACPDVAGTVAPVRDGVSARDSMFNFVLRATTRSTSLQRFGRVGRTGNASVFAPSFAGTGVPLPIQLSVMRYLEGGDLSLELVRRCSFPEPRFNFDGQLPYFRWVHLATSRLRVRFPLWQTNVQLIKAVYLVALELGGWTSAREVLLRPGSRYHDSVRPWIELSNDVLVGDIPTWVVDAAQSCAGFHPLDRVRPVCPSLVALYGEPPCFHLFD